MSCVVEYERFTFQKIMTKDEQINELEVKIKALEQIIKLKEEIEMNLKEIIYVLKRQWNNNYKQY